MEFETKRCILRPWMPKDKEECYFLAKDDRVGPITGWRPHTSVENSEEIIKNILMKDENYAIVLKDTNKLIGSFGIFHTMEGSNTHKDGELEIGFWIGVEFWGNGYIPEVARFMMNEIFKNRNQSRIWCSYYIKNDKSKRVQEKLGFRFHHQEVKEWVILNEKRETIYNCITKDEFYKGNKE